MKIAIIAITHNGARLGARLTEGLPGSGLYIPPKLGDHVSGPATVFPESLKELMARLWREADGLICIMATGIVVRMIAPHLEGKDRDPAVVVLDDAGKFAVSLLSGHLGGANQLAEESARLTGATPVITTATDANGLPSFDSIAREQGWAIDDLSRVKVLNSLLLEDTEIAVVDSSGQVEHAFRGRGRLTFHSDFQAAFRSGAKGFVFVTSRDLSAQVKSPCLLVLHPRNLILGVGCNRATSEEEIEEIILANLKRLSLSIKSVRSIATATAKQDEPGLLAVAKKFALPVVFYESSELNAIRTPTPPSQHALDAIGASGVAEPAALLASGNGKLILKKVKSGNVTLAVAEIP
ncbi:MAG: cobalt-precorrin 5A hydrolase [Geobacteraceae bacterium]|nr:cobalt-precorrin 5A hydrolase [Geobacteraceae bacterium]